jgi:CcmD family protein
MAPNVGYVIAAYLVTAIALGGYTLRLFARARSAKRRAQTIAERRHGGV